MMDDFDWKSLSVIGRTESGSSYSSASFHVRAPFVACKPAHMCFNARLATVLRVEQHQSAVDIFHGDVSTDGNLERSVAPEELRSVSISSACLDVATIASSSAVRDSTFAVKISSIAGNLRVSFCTWGVPG